jgi:hypothetical protein
VVSAGSYVLSAVLLVVLTLSLGFSAVLLRRRLLPEWEGAPAHLVEAVVGVALLIWLSELLGLFGLLYAGTLVGVSLLTALAIAMATERGREPGSSPRLLGFSPRALFRSPSDLCEKEDAATGERTPAPFSGPMLVTLGVVALVFAHWGLTTADALNRGIFNFDSLWYHMPFAVEMAQSHSVTGLHYTETVFTNWFYPQNSELLHSVGILLTERDTLSLFLNFGWLAMAFLAAWSIGRPYGRGHLSVVAVAILLSSHTLVVREPGAAKNDVMAAALLLAAIAILVNSETYLTRVARWRGSPIAEGDAKRRPSTWGRAAATGPASQFGPLAAAGLATGLAAGTKSTALAMAAALTVAAIALAPAGRRWAAAGWWFLPAFAGGGYWYLRNLIAVGNPLPQLEAIGPISLPHPEQLQSGRPDFSVVHYATDTGIWTKYFTPELHQAFGLLWPLVLGGALVGAGIALVLGRDRVLRWMGVVALFGLLAYLFTPLTAAGAEGAPEGFGINLRYAVPALLAGIALLPLALSRSYTSAPSAGGAVAGVPHSGGPREAASEHVGEGRRDRTRGLAVLSLLVGVLLVTDRLDAVLRDPDRIFAWLLALLLVLVPAGLLFARNRGGSRGAVAAGFAILTIAIAAIGYPLQRDYLDDRFANESPERSIPGMRLDSAYRWARGVEDARIGLAGTTAGFLQYGFYGTDLSNRVRYLGVEGPNGAFNAIPACGGFRAAVNAAQLDYLVTSPFLNFIETAEPIRSPEAGWLRGERAVTPLQRSGPVTVWRVRGRLDPAACGGGNAPLRYVPQQPGSSSG